LGEQLVAEFTTIGTGQGVPSGTVVHAPVLGSQHTCDGGVQGVTAEQGWPTKKIPGAGHAVAATTAAHAPVLGLQHAPPVPGGQGLGEQLVAVTRNVPAGQTEPL
jgi:hypothetical protein